MSKQLHLRAGIAVFLLAALCAVGAFLGVNQVSAASGDAGVPGKIPCFIDIKPMEDHIYLKWARPETGGEVKRWIVWLDPEAKGVQGDVKRPKAKKNFVTFRKLDPGYYTVHVRGRNDAGKGPRINVRLEVGGTVNMIPARKMCD